MAVYEGKRGKKLVERKKERKKGRKKGRLCAVHSRSQLFLNIDSRRTYSIAIRVKCLHDDIQLALLRKIVGLLRVRGEFLPLDALAVVFVQDSIQQLQESQLVLRKNCVAN